MFIRPVADALEARLAEPRRFIQVLTGPRQTGKTTAARQVIDKAPCPSHYASAYEPALRDRFWIEQQWEYVRLKLKSGGGGRAGGVLVLDEIQKVPGWSETVKRMWDEDSAGGW